mgnify:CR=1 FL=1
MWTPIGVVCRPTQREAEEFTAHIIDHADLGAVGNLADLHRRDAKDMVNNPSAFAFSGEGPVERRLDRRRRVRVVPLGHQLQEGSQGLLDGAFDVLPGPSAEGVGVARNVADHGGDGPLGNDRQYRPHGGRHRLR